jgi:hypothetical protein
MKLDGRKDDSQDKKDLSHQKYGQLDLSKNGDQHGQPGADTKELLISRPEALNHRGSFSLVFEYNN